AILRARDADINVLVGDGHAAVAGVLSQRDELRLRVLPVVLRRDSRVQGDPSSFHRRPPLSKPYWTKTQATCLIVSGVHCSSVSSARIWRICQTMSRS